MYRSPLHILEDLNTDTTELSDSKFLLRLRKKLLAEFDLSNLPTIDINGKAYSKDEVIKTIDVLLGDSQMPLHSYIFANKGLLDFLENDKSNVRAGTLKSLTVPQEIVPMLSVLMFERILSNLKRAFFARDFGVINELFSYTPNLQEEEKSNLFEELNKNILNLNEHIKNLHERGCKNFKQELDYLRNPSFVRFVNSLPEDFDGTIYLFMCKIVNTMVSYQKLNGHDRACLFHISDNIRNIKGEETLMKLIRSNHEAFQQNYSESSSDGMSAANIVRALFLIVVLVVFLFNIFKNDNSSSRFRNANLSYETNEYQEFRSYRNYILTFRKGGSSKKYSDPKIEMKPSMSGKSPFRIILNNGFNFAPTDTIALQLIIDNKTSHDLILFAFNGTDAKAYYFFKNKADTLKLMDFNKMALYFGDSLAGRPSLKNSNLSVALLPSWEVYFAKTTNEALKIFSEDYILELEQPVKFKRSKNKNRKPGLPVIIFEDSFFEKGKFESERVKLYSDNLNTEVSGDTVEMREVIVAP